MVRLPPDEIARIVSRGTAMLRTWPDGIRDWAQQAARESSDDADRYVDVRTRLRRIASGDTFFPSNGDLMEEAFPDLRARLSHSFAGNDRYYLGFEVDRLLGISHAKTVSLRSRGLLPFTNVPGGTVRTSGRYCADGVDRLARLIRSSISISSCQPIFRLPVYAIEQLICSGLLDQARSPALDVLFDLPHVLSASVENLKAQLMLTAARGCKREEMVALSQEISRIGGRAKPWAAIYSALLSGKLTFSSWGGAASHELFIFPGSLDEFATVHFRESDYPAYRFADEFHTEDVGEFLNLPARRVVELRAEGMIGSIRRAKSRRTTRIEVQALAAKYVSPGELARLGRTSVERVTNVLAANGRLAERGLWLRSDVMNDLPRR